METIERSILEFFCVAWTTGCANEGETWCGEVNLCRLLHAKFHPHRCRGETIYGTQKCKCYEIWGYKSPQGRILGTILVKFSGFVGSSMINWRFNLVRFAQDVRSYGSLTWSIMLLNGRDCANVLSRLNLEAVLIYSMGHKKGANLVLFVTMSKIIRF